MLAFCLKSNIYSTTIIYKNRRWYGKGWAASCIFSQY